MLSSLLLYAAKYKGTGHRHTGGIKETAISRAKKPAYLSALTVSVLVLSSSGYFQAKKNNQILINVVTKIKLDLCTYSTG